MYIYISIYLSRDRNTQNKKTIRPPITFPSSQSIFTFMRLYHLHYFPEGEETWGEKSTCSVSRSSFFFFFCIFRVAPMAYGGSQARGGHMGAAAAGLCHRHSH